MNSRPLVLLIVLCAVLVCVNYGFTGAATTQSFVTILGPGQPPTPGPGPAVGPTAAAAPAMPSVPAKIFYIGDFALKSEYTVWTDVDETWVFTFKGQNHTIKEIYANINYAEFELASSPVNLKLFLNQPVQIDADLNGFSDVKITLNAVNGTKANLTLQIQPETMIIMNYVITPDLLYLLLALLIGGIIADVLLTHRKRKKGFVAKIAKALNLK